MQRRLRTRRLEQQANLFEAQSDRPRWTQLSSAVRSSVTELIARMLRPERLQATCEEQEVEHE